MIEQHLPEKILTWADEKTVHTSPLRRLGHSACRVILITIQEFRKNDLSLRAAALTFTVMLSLVPMLAMSTALVKGLGGGDQLRNAVFSYVKSLDNGKQEPVVSQEPPQGQQAEPGRSAQNQSSKLTQHLETAIHKVFDYVDKTNFATLGTFGVAGMILSVILVLGNIEIAMNTIWKVESGRSIMRKIADYLALLVLVPISVNIGLAAGTVLGNEKLLTKFSVVLPVLWIQPLILKLLPILSLSLTLYVIYLFFPNTKVKTIPALIGAIFAGIFWFEAQNIYIAMQVGVARYNAIYGSFATLPLFLMWMYFGWIFILAGAQLAYASQNTGSYNLVPLQAQPSLRLAIAYDLLGYIQEQFEKQTPVTLEELKAHFPMHRDKLVEEVTDELTSQNLVHRSENGSRFMPSLPKEKLDNSRIISAILGTTFSKTEGGETSRKVIAAAALP